MPTSPRRPGALTHLDDKLLGLLATAHALGRRWIPTEEIVIASGHVRIVVVHNLRDLHRRGLVCPQARGAHAWSATTTGFEAHRQHHAEPPAQLFPTTAPF